MRNTAGDRTSRVDAVPGAETPDRHETPTERLDRNWSALLQELRVTQTGVQLLTGFLLTLPFQGAVGAVVAAALAAAVFVGLWVLLPLLLRGVRDGANPSVSSATLIPGSDTRAVRR
ncbi:hypothetical protein G4X40_11590 [Rhodococcus sp. D2-41]|nr:hypothetical protein [Rhodococcus sp. D2-41]